MKCDNCYHKVHDHAMAAPSPCRECDCEAYVAPGFGPFTEPPEGAELTNNKQKLRDEGYLA